MSRTQRCCKNCGKIFFGNIDSLMCPECAKISRKQNVIRTRICIDCGRSFEGGPRAKRCPECRNIATSENKKRHIKSGTVRALGSIDICVLCGHEYIVNSGRQKYCPACRQKAMLKWQRDHKAENSYEAYKKKQERRKQRKKVCAYCLRTFWVNTSSNLCSNYCRSQQKRMNQYKADIKRGYNCNIQELEKLREEYRNTVKFQQGDKDT